jgi:hypothetical protein
MAACRNVRSIVIAAAAYHCGGPDAKIRRGALTPQLIDSTWAHIRTTVDK